MNKINDRLKAIRKALGYTQTHIANLIGITQGSWQQLESGRTNPSEQTLLLLQEKFHVNLNWLKTGEGKMFDDFKVDLNKISADKYHEIVDLCMGEPNLETLKKLFEVCTPELKEKLFDFVSAMMEVMLRKKKKSTRIEFEDPPDREIDPSIEKQVAEFRNGLYLRKTKTDHELSTAEKRAIIEAELQDEEKATSTPSIRGNSYIEDSK